MAWVAFDRAVRTVEHFGAGRARRPLARAARRGSTARSASAGYDAERGTFTQSYGSRGLDAATLMIPRRRLPAARRRARGRHGRGDPARAHAATASCCATTPREADDGLPPGEGAFLPCSFWLADCLALIGRHDEARELFDRLAGLANDVGLLAEEYDPRLGRQVGNFPQAFTHVGLVNTAMNLDRARSSPAEDRAEREGAPS